MKIAVLAWDTLANDLSWRTNGPLLPIEFAKTSPQGNLIPVLCGEPWVLDVPTLWAPSTSDEFEQACHHLANQEGIPVNEIGYFRLGANGTEDTYQLDSLPNKHQHIEVLDRLKRWLQDHEFDALIWNDSRADFLKGKNLNDARSDAVAYLKKLQNNDESAEKSIRQVPIQVWTAIRASISIQLGWAPEPTPPQIKTADDLLFKEWDQCRATIGRLDTILVDLRKAGFPLITGLLTASTFLGFLGIGTGQSLSSHPPFIGAAAAFIVVMILVAALFSIDIYYQVLISGAAERALDLEKMTSPPIRITRHTSSNALASKTNYIILFLYLILLSIAVGLGLLATEGPNLTFGFSEIWIGVWILVVVLGVIILIVISWRCETLPKGLLPIILSAWFIAGVLFFIVPKHSNILSWVVCCIGTALALYIGIYWSYISILLHLNREKKRNWPRDGEKVLF